MEPEVSLPPYKCPPPVAIPSQINPFQTPNPTSSKSILILSYNLRLELPSGLFPSDDYSSLAIKIEIEKRRNLLKE